MKCLRHRSHFHNFVLLFTLLKTSGSLDKVLGKKLNMITFNIKMLRIKLS